MKSTKENLKLANREVRRLMSIEPLNDAQVNELSDVALDEFPSPEALHAGITVILHEWDRVLTPKQLIEFARQHHPPKPKPKSNCTSCYGSGQMYAWHLITFDQHGRKKTSERLTKAQHEDLRGKKLDPNRQRVYELPVPCRCVHSDGGAEQEGADYDPDYERLSFRDQLLADGCNALVEMLDNGELKAEHPLRKLRQHSQTAKAKVTA